jgi:two-component sensor histidine kinase
VEQKAVEFLADDDRKVLLAIATAAPPKPELAFVTFAKAAGKNLKTDYRGADLRGYALRGQDLSEVNLEYADLRGADLRGATGYRQRGTRVDEALSDTRPQTQAARQKQSKEIAPAEKFARSVLEQATGVVVVCDADGRIVTASRAAERLLNTSLQGKWLVDALPMEEVSPATDLSSPRMSSSEVLKLVLQGYSLHDPEVQICLPALYDKYFLLSAGPLSDKVDGCIGCILTLTEITARKRAETQQTMLIAELNHRVKNILAIVQSVAWQTLSANQSPSEFKRAFDGRLRAISLAHDILTQGRWGHVDFEQLVERSLAPYHGGDHGKRAEWSGSRLSLPPNMVVPLSMVLHELSTNAARYGAFSVEHGRVNIAWRTDGAKVRFTWIETNGPPIKGEIKAGFGSKLISRVVSYDLVGTADLDFDREGFRCTLTFPIPRLSTDAVRQSLPTAEPSSVRIPTNRHRESKRNLTAVRILVVEDESLIAINLELILRSLGCEVVGLVSEVRDIVDAVKKYRPDGVFLDVNLPDREVFDVLPELISLGVPCVLTSDHGDPTLFPPVFRNLPRIAKPFDESAIRRACIEIASIAEARQPHRGGVARSNPKEANSVPRGQRLPSTSS